MKSTAFILIATSLLSLSSCTTDRQFHGTATGAMVGGMFGSSIGGLMGGWRGSDAGTLVGMVVGGAVGNALTAPENTERRSHDYDNYAREERTEAAPPVVSTKLDAVVIENVRFIDENRNKRLDHKERAKLVFEIYNRGSRTVYNIAPLITTDQDKRILLSPPAIIESIGAGKGVRYTADIYVRSRLPEDGITFRIDLTDGSSQVQRRVFRLPTGRRR